jgi:translocation and assembly module TamA
MRPLAWLWAGAVLIQAAGAAAAKVDDRRPCPRVEFVGGDAIHLTDVERKLVCGDEATEGWREVPGNQARYFLESFLQPRGYQNPRFQADQGTLKVYVGTRSYIRSLTVTGLPAGIDISKRRGLEGRPMTPKELDAIRTALVDYLQESGYACPRIEMTADSQTGEVTADIAPGPVYTIDVVAPAGLTDVDPAIFTRYEAFQYGGRFDARLLALTARRTLADALFTSARYDVSCSTAGLKITQRVVQGKPRLIRIGVGFDTEDYAIGKAVWKDSRLGKRTSSVEGSLFASYREQSADVFARAYFYPGSRMHLRPRAVLRRQNEPHYEDVSAEASVLPETSWDFQDWRLDLAAGPAVDYVSTVRGAGPAQDTFLVLRTRLEFTDHLFEYYAAEPRSGWRASLESASRFAGAYSSLTAQHIAVSGEMLWNLGNYMPPLVVIGTRYWAGTTLVSDRAAALRDLAPDMRFYMGGDANLRGAARGELPGDDAGYLTVVYDGVEVRMGDVLARGLQPLAFVDAAMAGRADLHLDRDIYWSPGAGLRWRLPVGAIRLTVARGFVALRAADTSPRYRPHWQFFFGFGREF